MEIVGVVVSLVTKKEMLSRIASFVEDGRKHHIVTTNPEYVVEAQRNESFKSVINSADISVIDGVGIVVGLRYMMSRIDSRSQFLFYVRSYISFILAYISVGFLRRETYVGSARVERIGGVDLIWLVVQQEWMRGRRMYLVGGSDNVSSQAVKRLQHTNPDILFRCSNGLRNVRRYSEDENDVIIADINSFRPDILLVAYGHPWQDMWISRYRDKLDFKIAIGVGGSFDYIAQRVVRAPLWMRRSGLEWAYRLVREPVRYRRIVRATVEFVHLLIRKRYDQMQRGVVS